MLIIIGAFIALFLASLALMKPDKDRSSYLLIIWLIIFGVHMGLSYSLFYGYTYNIPFLLGWNLPMPLLHGPLMYLYIQSILEKPSIRRDKYSFFHFLLPLGLNIYQIPFFLLSSEDKLSFYLYQEQHTGIYSRILYILILLSGFSYTFLALLLWRKHNKRLVSKRKNWIRFVIYGFGILWMAILMINEVPSQTNENTPLWDIIVYGSVAFYVIILAFLGISMTSIFSSIPKETSTYNTQPLYKKSTLTPEQARSIATNLQSSMERNKFYLQSDLKLPYVAEQLNVQANHLSQTINEYLKLSFNEYINTLRITEFINNIHRIASGEHNIITLAYECGFNSKSSFNSVFKRIAGDTPKAFINKSNPEG
ncbi:helix-turn-helix domain-containing protein [Spirochaeta cellobiosiphila]|uniref:helix-turn-helix domain-containing protein n=1 Tax=Spirochaeta cellobiosiphila TaxID=504483 RepID=UPI000410A218|nr:response regulator transcription factor [Spirochaeta cellobiosiphila]